MWGDNLIVAGTDLARIHPKILSPYSAELLNPASIDIRIGGTYQREGEEPRFLLDGEQLVVEPGERILVATLENIKVFPQLAIELRLKSTRAREGWNHALAFWFDPGWNGIGTMELINSNRKTALWLQKGMKIAQLIVHTLSTPVDNGYNGRYQGAAGVEAAKPEKGHYGTA